MKPLLPVTSKQIQDREGINLDLYNNLTTIAAVVIGFLIGFVVQWMMFRAQEKKDKREAMNALNREKLEVYGLLLKIGADHEMSKYFSSGNVQFNSTVYGQKIRPLVYEKLFLLDPYVADKIRYIDGSLAEERMIGIPDFYDQSDMQQVFNDMIEFIEKKIRINQQEINKHSLKEFPLFVSKSHE